MLRYVYAMSKSKRDIHAELNESVDKMMEHLVKIIEFPDALARDHWITEVYSFCNRIPKLKGTNKYPSTRFIYSILSSNNDIMASYIRYVKTIESTEQFAHVSEEGCIEIVDKYQYWLSAMLSRYGSVSLAEVSATINSIVCRPS